MSGRKKVETVDLLKEGTLLPPTPDKCQKCGIKHDLELPHDQQSMYWQYWFKKENGRWPTWDDAMEHCTEGMKQFWLTELRKLGEKV